MKIKRFLWIALASAFIVTPLAAQTSHPAGAAVFAPFVSELQGELKNGLIRLSWADSPDIKGPVSIYRSARPFDGSSPLQGSGARPVVIPYGVQSYVDEIEAGGTLYVFAVASDESGRAYEIPIASTNMISIQISAGNSIPVPVSAPAPVVAEKPAPEKPPVQNAGISALEASAQGDRIVITYNPGNVKNAALYRSIRPISQTQDLLGAVILQTKISTPYIDYAVPGIPYYYAVVAEEDLVQGTVDIIPGRNSTRAAAGIPASGSPERALRAIPLPQISTQAVAPGMSAYPEALPTELSRQAAAALSAIPARPPEQDLKKPRVFARDLEIPSERGEDYVLSSVVRGSFTAKDWNASREQLANFLALPRNPDTRARARFYLGQSYYFLQKPREGLFEFLSIQDRYPAEAAEWIQASLDMLKK